LADQPDGSIDKITGAGDALRLLLLLYLASKNQHMSRENVFKQPILVILIHKAPLNNLLNRKIK